MKPKILFHRLLIPTSILKNRIKFFSFPKESNLTPNVDK